MIMKNTPKIITDINNNNKYLVSYVEDSVVNNISKYFQSLLHFE